MFAWCSGSPGKKQSATRKTLLLTLCALFLIAPVMKVVSTTMPMSPRPLVAAENIYVVDDGAMIASGRIDYRAPATGLAAERSQKVAEGTIADNDLFSFPSDHAALFAAFAGGIFLAMRAAGLAAFGWAILGVFLPRVATGLHWPSDMIAGALAGLVILALVVGAGRSLLDRVATSRSAAGVPASPLASGAYDRTKLVAGFGTARCPAARCGAKTLCARRLYRCRDVRVSLPGKQRCVRIAGGQSAHLGVDPAGDGRGRGLRGRTPWPDRGRPASADLHDVSPGRQKMALAGEWDGLAHDWEAAAGIKGRFALLPRLATYFGSLAKGTGFDSFVSDDPEPFVRERAVVLSRLGGKLRKSLPRALSGAPV